MTELFNQQIFAFSRRVGVSQKPGADFGTWSKSRWLPGLQAMVEPEKGFWTGLRGMKTGKSRGKGIKTITQECNSKKAVPTANRAVQKLKQHLCRQLKLLKSLI